MDRKNKLTKTAPASVQALLLALGAVLFFIAVCLCSAATVRAMAMLLVLLALSAAFLFWERLRERLKPPALALALMVLMDLVSCAYAVSGKFALQELLKVLAAFCLALLLLTLTGGENPGRKAAAVLEGFCVIAGLTSVDLLSTRWISGFAQSILGCFTTAYTDIAGVEEGVRMTSIFRTPNTFAGCMGIGVLLSLGLTLSSKKPRERTVHLICLLINSLAFLLTFSMGACAAIVPAFLVLLALTGKPDRAGMLILMIEALAVTMLAAVPISITSMTTWDGFQPIPLLCTAGGAAVLCALDRLGQRLAAKLDAYGKAVLCLIAGILAGIVVFFAAAYNLTAGMTFQAGESMRRSIYPAPGAYTVISELDGSIEVTITSQNQADTTMHTSTELYRGPLSQAAFAVPDDSLVVWFDFTAEEAAYLESVLFEGENGAGSVPLKYSLLPGFIANRLQGLWANQNAIQRFAFFEDGIKLFMRSPAIGLGLGAYGNGVIGVQSFYYYTRYAHNHYIQALVETGLVGLALFLGLLAVSGVSIWRGRKRPMSPALGAALVFMAAHGAVEVTFSHYTSMPILFSMFTVISLHCGDEFPAPAWAEKKSVKNGIALGVCALLVVFGVLLGCNSAAANMVGQSADLDTLERAAALDPFEKADYMLTYVVQVTRTEPDEETRRKADEYAARLERLDSNIIPYYLAEYYLDSGRTEHGLELAERYVTYVASDLVTWQNTFELLELYEQDTPEYRAAVAHMADLLDTWNRDNLGHIEVDEQAQAFIDRMRS